MNDFGQTQFLWGRFFFFFFPASVQNPSPVNSLHELFCYAAFSDSGKGKLRVVIFFLWQFTWRSRAMQHWGKKNAKEKDVVLHTWTEPLSSGPPPYFILIKAPAPGVFDLQTARQTRRESNQSRTAEAVESFHSKTGDDPVRPPPRRQKPRQHPVGEGSAWISWPPKTWFTLQCAERERKTGSTEGS